MKSPGILALCGIAVCAHLTAAPAAAQTTVLGGSHAITGPVCIGGSDCTSTETFDNGIDLKIKDLDTRILLQDSSTSEFATTDWEIVANDQRNAGNDEYFGIRNVDDNRMVFRIDDGAPQNAFHVGSNGKLGMGTSLPVANIHIAAPVASPALRLQSTTAGQSWQIGNPFSNAAGLQIYDVTASSTPFYIRTGGNNENAFVIAGGNVGLGVAQPEEKLHIQTSTPDTDAFALFDAAGPGSDSAFRLRQQGLIPTTWEFRNQQDSGRLNIGIAGGNTPLKIDDAANNNLLRLGLNGQPDVVAISGRLRVNNTDISVPDYVFADDYALRPLAEVAAFIDIHSHLPEVPSETEIAANGWDMTEMQMTLLKKVEELTLYTLDQQKVIADHRHKVTALNNQLAEQNRRIDALARILHSQITQAKKK